MAVDEVALTSLSAKLAGRTATVAVLGLGYAGLPMALEFAHAGFSVVGIDVDARRVSAVADGRSPVSDVSDAELAPLVRERRLRATADYRVLAEADAAVICFPTPLGPSKSADHRFVEAAARGLAAQLHPGMLVVLQSTSAPGTTRGVVLPLLAQSGLDVGRDYFLAFAPERIDPGNPVFGVRNTPKVIGGITAACTEQARLLYQPVVQRLVEVSSPEAAELAKLVENTFRFVNISFVNEIAMLCDRLGVSVWEVLEAAATKPFAYLPHWPGPGVGGHCIPVVPYYLQAAAREAGVASDLIAAAGRVNDAMPAFVADKAERLLRERGVAPDAASLLVVGVTYKPNVNDVRESPGVALLEEWIARGRAVRYHDPHVGALALSGQTLASVALSAAELRRAECVVLVTAHRELDEDLVLREAKLVLDTRNLFKQHRHPNLVAL